MKKLLVLLCLILASWSVRAQQDSVRVSLLTCAPGTEIYELFGHTAIRYENPAEGKDLVLIMVSSVSILLILCCAL